MADSVGEHPRRHLKEFKGALQADAYSGYVANAVMLRTLQKLLRDGQLSEIGAT
jgi:hypothetical protein